MERNKYSNGKYTMQPVNDFNIFTGFTCCNSNDNDYDLDNFLRDDAEQHLKDLMSVTYSIIFSEKELAEYPLAFFTLQNDALTIGK